MRVRRALDALDAWDVAGRDSIAATKIATAPNIVNRSACRLALVRLALVRLALVRLARVRLARVRRFNDAVGMDSLGERTHEMCAPGGTSATRSRRFCGAFPHSPGPSRGMRGQPPSIFGIVWQTHR